MSIKIPLIYGVGTDGLNLLPGLKKSKEFKMFAGDSRDRGLINPLEFGDRDPAMNLSVSSTYYGALPSDDTLPAPDKDDALFSDQGRAMRQILDVLDELPDDPNGIRYYDDEDISLDPRLDGVVNRPRRRDDGDSSFPDSIQMPKDFVKFVKKENAAYMAEQNLFLTQEEQKVNVAKKAQPSVASDILKQLAKLGKSANTFEELKKFKEAFEESQQTEAPTNPTSEPEKAWYDFGFGFGR